VSIRVLYEDADLVAVDKPSGVTVIPARDEPKESSLRLRLENERGESLFVVHRIDRDTSGVVIFARNAAAHRALSMAFERHEVKKTYDAFTRGVPEPQSGTITTPLHTARKGKMRPAAPGESETLASETVYSVASRVATELGPVSRVVVCPRTGRQHQIRVHLRSIDTPLLVDPLYARCDRLELNALGRESPVIDRLTLHARQIEFAHPTRGELLAIESPLAPDLAALEAWLQSYRSV
jgi:tRNA pseudouridine32 synthase/23S rRNA pseudouridine746 synthase